ncbi:MAG: YifB family Mg chelatase-like AAA ATPase [Bacteroidaceae bacterium]|nr:YifB family Mg chelatase-like AAA ATPase [Bacteroidaceae bacterium]MDO4955984.1 YifB family Mg chelatase-like AAA ATPase [Bacteroidales bacterium]
MLVKVFGAAVQGIEATTITIEVNTSRGIKFFLVGLPDTSVKESHERIVSALQYNGFRFPTTQIIINMAPADIRKEGSSYDLPLAIGIMAAAEMINSETISHYMIMGELSLDGSLQPIRGALPIALRAKEDGFEGIILPQQNAKEAAVVNGLKVYGVSNILQVINFFNGKEQLKAMEFDVEKEFFKHQSHCEFDFSEVRGQSFIKRAFEVAASGGHNLILVGSPGSGKSMMAKRLPGILPPLTLSESVETTQIHSVAGLTCRTSSLVTARPFRSPHHSISSIALVGGGHIPQPGEISLAHNGVLFLDELPEFNRAALEVLRQPLEDHKISVSRATYSVEYPCSFMFIASMNPCPCGYYGHPTKECVCAPGQVQRYMNRISGPLLDRIDIQCEIQPLPINDITNAHPEEPSECIRKRVISARKIQEKRFENDKGCYCNAQMTEKMIQKYAQPNKEGLELLRMSMNRLNLSARAYSRILKVARTIADLDASDDILPHHLAEAIAYRKMDRSDY